MHTKKIKLKNKTLQLGLCQSSLHLGQKVHHLNETDKSRDIKNNILKPGQIKQQG